VCSSDLYAPASTKVAFIYSGYSFFHKKVFSIKALCKFSFLTFLLFSISSKQGWHATGYP
jgi:hypothetical protein